MNFTDEKNIIKKNLTKDDKLGFSIKIYNLLLKKLIRWLDFVNISKFPQNLSVGKFVPFEIIA